MIIGDWLAEEVALKGCQPGSNIITRSKEELLLQDIR